MKAGGRIEFLKFQQDLTRGGEALRGVALEHLHDRATQRWRDAFVCAAGGGNLGVEGAVDALCEAGPVERIGAGEDLVEDHAKGEDVGAFGGGLLAEEFWGDVAGGSADRFFEVRKTDGFAVVAIASQESGEAEVDDLCRPRLIEQDVFGLEVAVQDGSGV